MQFDENPFTCQCEKKTRRIKGSTGRFQVTSSVTFSSKLSDILAVKLLRIRELDDELSLFRVLGISI